MSEFCQEGGRLNQKKRTYLALLHSAAELVRAGTTPSVTDVADAAAVSRRTAYRYFPTQEQLLTEVSLESLRPQVEAILEVAAAKGDIEAVLDEFVTAVQQLSFENEGLLRAMIRLTVDHKPGAAHNSTPKRGSRRVDWIEIALRPLRCKLSKACFERLVSGVALVVGIEALIVLRDIRGLDRKKSIGVSRWAARALVRASLAEDGK